MLHVLPVHHSPGISLTFLSPLITGCRIEFGPKGRFSPAAMWDRWLRGGLTLFSGVPTMYQRMMRYYEDDIVAKRGPQEAQRHVEAAQNIRSLLCGTSALPFTLQAKWIKLLGGQKRILERYGGTKFTGIFGVQQGDMNNPDVSLSSAAIAETFLQISLGLTKYLGSLPGCEVKLSEGNEGEILSKSHDMFIE